MCQQVPERDRIGGICFIFDREADIRIEVRTDGIVQVQLSLFEELHDGCPGKYLGNGSGSEQVRMRIDSGSCRQIGKSVPMKQLDAIGCNQSHGGVRYLLVLYQPLHLPVQEDCHFRI
jgi:hypothetical protein